MAIAGRQPKAAEIGVMFDRTTGTCAASPVPTMAVQMCPAIAERHVFVEDDQGRLVSLYACADHEALAVSAGYRLITIHPIDRDCLNPAAGLWLSAAGGSWCMPTPGGAL
jgi:hypothetical protein